MKRYKRKKKFKEGMLLIRNEKYPDSTTVKAGAWCVLKSIKSSTEFDIEWQILCPEWNHQSNGIYPSKLFKKAPIWPEGTKLRYERSSVECTDWMIGEKCIIVNSPILLHSTILMKIKWIEQNEFIHTPINSWYYPWNFEAIE